MRTRFNRFFIAPLFFACAANVSSALPGSPPPANVTLPAPNEIDAGVSTSVQPPPVPLDQLQLRSLELAVDALNHHDGKKYSELFTPNVILREAAAPDAVGRHDLAGRMQLLFDSFPDFKFSIDKVWLKENIAVALWRFTGTDRGGYLGKKPSGVFVGLTGVSVGFYNTDGLVREIHMYEDGQTITNQTTGKPGRFPPAEPQAPMEVIVAKPNDRKQTELTKNLYDAMEAKNETALMGLFASDATVDDLALPPKPGHGPNAWKSIWSSWKNSFGAFTTPPLFNLLLVNDYFIAERALDGTMNGKSVVLHSIDIGQFESSHIKRLSTWSNTLELITQVGPKAIR